MIVPIVSIPTSVANGLSGYKDLFPRSETFQHIQEYCTGIIMLDRPSIQRMSQCFVDGPCQSSLNKAITSSPWSGVSVNQRSLDNDRLDAFEYRIYHRSFQKQESLYLEHMALPDDESDIGKWRRRLVELLWFQLHKEQGKTKSQLAVELIDEMEASQVAPSAYAVDSGLFTPLVIERIQQADKPWIADSQKNRVVYYKGQEYNCETFQQTIPKESLKEVTVSIRHKERTRWVFTCSVRIRRYGKVWTAPPRSDSKLSQCYCFL